MAVAAPVDPPKVLSASMDEYIARVLARIPESRRGVVGVDVSNAGVAGSVGVRIGKDVTAVGFVGKINGHGVTYGGRAQFVF